MMMPNADVLVPVGVHMSICKIIVIGVEYYVQALHESSLVLTMFLSRGFVFAE